MKNITKLLALAVVSTLGIGAVANAELLTNTESTTATCAVSKSNDGKHSHNDGKHSHKDGKKHKDCPKTKGHHGKKHGDRCSHAGTKTVNLNIVGTWMHTDADDRENEYIRFAANGTGEKWEQKTTGLKQVKDRKNFTYTFKDGVLTTRKRGGDVDTDVVYTVAADQIRFDGDIYVRVN